MAATLTDTARRRKKVMFLEEYARSGNLTLACQFADVHRSTYYEWAEHDLAFTAAAKQSLEHAADILEQEARRRAVEGVQKPVFYKGELIPADVREYSDVLLIFLLKGARPEKYRERMEVQHTGSVVKAVDREAWESV